MGNFTTDVTDLIDVAKGIKAQMVIWEKKLLAAKSSEDPVRLALSVSSDIYNYIEKGEEFEKLEFIRQAIRRYAGSKDGR